MGVHFTTIVISSDVDVLLVQGADHKNVCRCAKELYTSEGSSWDGSGTMSRFRAPGDSLSFGISDSAVRNGRSPDAEIWSMAAAAVVIFINNWLQVAQIASEDTYRQWS